MKKKSPAARQFGPSARRVGRGVPIVGVGASAGGLEAFTLLLKRLPVDTGFGFVLVQHLDPQHESSLTQILARATAMLVTEVTNNLRVEANHVYVIPPNASLGMAHGVLKLQPRAQSRRTLRSIDYFFESLAKDQHERAIGVILSGTATDGTLGLEAIKAEGGLTFAQDDSARYDSMPRSAVAAGCVDFVLSPDGIAKELARIAKHPYVADGAPETFTPAKTKSAAKAGGARKIFRPPGAENGLAGRAGSNGYQKILLLLRNHSGVDFSLYKTATIHRRITRRMVLNKQNTVESYLEFLRGNPKELDALYSDVLINVTSFFRNADAFDVLQRKIFPPLLKQGGDEPVRVWVLGCSTGQEAFSLAMAFTECAKKYPHPRKLQVFATDLNEANLEKARHGLYAKSVMQDVSPERLRRFFVEEEGGYRVIKPLRELVVFARQNLINDPPFSRMDLISCRNLMIYLEPILQKKALPTFHYALKPEGYLFLGASESVGTFTDLFAPVDKKQKIFAKKAAPTLAFHLPVKNTGSAHHAPEKTPRAAPAPGKKLAGPPDAFRGELNAEREADRVTVNQFAPPSVLINADLQILQFRGATGAFLEPPTGKASFDVLKMAREGLMLPLRAAINQAKKENKTARAEDVPLGGEGKTRRVNVEVVPLKNLKERCFLVLFEDAEKRGPAWPVQSPIGEPVGAVRPVNKKEEASRAAGLERTLAETRDYLQSIQEQHEAANEELQSANEEGQSANEELQSLNEELETSKEELESTNEELTTVNEEMANRNTELNRLNSDLVNLQTSAKLAIILLGRDLTIRRFSAQAEKKFHLHAADLGKPISHIRHNLELPDLEAIITEVIASVRETEREVRDKDGRWYSLRVRPYITLDNKVDGAVLVLVDINALKAAEQEVVHARDFAEAVISTVRDPLLILDAELRVQKVNQSFLTTFRISAAEVTGHPLFKLDQGCWESPKLRSLLGEIRSRHNSFDNFEVTQNFKSIGRRTFLLNARMLSQDPGHREKILLGFQDVTAVLGVQTELRRSEKRYRRLFETAKDGILILDPGTRKIVDANPFILSFLGYTPGQLIGKELWQIGLLKDEAASRKAFRALKKKGLIRYENLPLKTKGGQRRDVEFVSNRYQEDGRDIIQCNIRDITVRKQAEEALLENEWQLRYATNSARLTYVEADLVHGGARTAENFAAVMGYCPPPEQETDISAGTRLLLKHVVPDDRPQVAAALKKFISGKPVGKIEYRVLGDDQIERWIESRWSMELNPKGKPLKSFATNLDITERKRAEEALRQSEERFRAAVGIVSSLIWTNNADGLMVGAQPGWGKFTGQTLEEYRGYGWAKAVHPDDAQPTIEAWKQAVAESRLFEFEHRIRRRDGEWRLCSIRAVPLLGGDGLIREWVGVHSDITERKRAEAAVLKAQAQLSRHAGQLEVVVTKRTAQLTAANRRLEASVVSIDRGRHEYQALFLESEISREKLRQMAHQILSAQEDERKKISRELHDSVVQTLVGINVELSALGKAGAAGLPALQKKIAHTQRLVENSVHAVHQFARELRPAVLDDLGLIPALQAYLKVIAERKKLKIHLTAFAGVEALDNDRRTVLYRVAQEALTNVGRHAQASLVRVSLSKLPGAVRMDVHDNGKSFSVKSTLSPKTNQRLGLLGMRERVEMVGGTLHIESAPGHGTTVRAEIPFRNKGAK